MDHGGSGNERGQSTWSGRSRRGLCGYCDSVARRIPFEKPPVRDQHPPGGAHNRIQAEECLVREARERKRSLREVLGCAAHCGSEVLTQAYIAWLL